MRVSEYEMGSENQIPENTHRWGKDQCTAVANLINILRS